MVQPKRFLGEDEAQEDGERNKRQNSGDLRPRVRRMSSEESEYTTDETSEDEEYDEITPSSAPSSRKSCKAPRRWQPSEDRRLEESVRQHGEANWKAIAARVGSRNHVQCLQRWKKVLRPGLVKGQWSAKEDAVLMKLASSGYKNWGVLSNHMPGRTSKQCRERWCHHLDPSINKGAYTPREDKTIIETQARIGNKWSQIAAQLPGRTENSIKIRCKALQRRGNGGAPLTANQSRVPNGRRASSTTAPRNRAISTSTDAIVSDQTPTEAIDPSPDMCPADPETSFNCAPAPLGIERSASSPPMRSINPLEGMSMPFSNPPRAPFFQQQHSFTEGTTSSFSHASFSAKAMPSRVRAPPVLPPTISGGGDQSIYDGCWRSWSRPLIPPTSRASITLPVESSMWPSTVPVALTTTSSAVKREQLAERAPSAGSCIDYSIEAGSGASAPVAPSTIAAVFGRMPCENLPAAPRVSPFFAFGANAIMGYPAAVVEQGQAGAAGIGGQLKDEVEGAGGAAVGDDMVKTEHTGDVQQEEDMGDLSTLDVNDLQAVVGGMDKEDTTEAAPLRSCCSFLDLPGEGMVVGDMPLSW